MAEHTCDGRRAGLSKWYALLLAMSAAACDGGGPPTSPTGPPPPPPVALTVVSVSPQVGFGGSSVVISGTGFAAGAAVLLGEPSSTVTVLDGTRIRATAPNASPGTVDVVVTNPGGQHATLPAGFTYNAVTLTASAAMAAAGARLTVTWNAVSARCSSDWIGIFELGDPSTSYEKNWWDYAACGNGGEHELTAPTTPGQYEFRYLLDDAYQDVARSVPITIY